MGNQAVPPGLETYAEIPLGFSARRESVDDKIYCNICCRSVAVGMDGSGIRRWP